MNRGSQKDGAEKMDKYAAYANTGLPATNDTHALMENTVCVALVVPALFFFTAPRTH